VNGTHDLAAIEAAELHALRDKAAQRRDEAGDTLAALVNKFPDGAGPQALVKRWALARLRSVALPAAAVAIPAGVATLVIAWWIYQHRSR
jgi:hypothetical protein